MPRKEKELMDDMLHVPINRSLKREIYQLAQAEDRKPADMARVLWREALEARKAVAAAK